MLIGPQTTADMSENLEATTCDKDRFGAGVGGGGGGGDESTEMSSANDSLPHSLLS